MPRMFRTTLNFILAGIFILSAAACASPTQPPTATPVPTPSPEPTLVEQGIYGRWSGVDNNNDDIIMVFDGSGKVTLSYLGSLHGGTFTLNEKTTPMQLDLIWDESGTILTILEFIDRDTIRFENNYPTVERPTTFSDFVTLKRIK